MRILIALADELDVSVPNLVVTGVGKVNAALAAARVIAEHKPSLVVNFGTAGGVRCAPGQLVEVAQVLQRDADCEPLAPRGTLLGDVTSLSSGRPGVCCGSGDSFVRGVETWVQERCDVVDMELWGIAKACAQAGVAWRSVKWVSDVADENAAEHWRQNVAQGSQAFSAWLKQL